MLLCCLGELSDKHILVEISSAHTLPSGTPAPTTSTRPQPLLQSFLWRGWREQGAQKDGWISEEGTETNTRTTRMEGMNERMDGMRNPNKKQIKKPSKSRLWQGLWRWQKGEGLVMEGFIAPVKWTGHNFTVTSTSYQCDYAFAVRRHIYRLRAMLWRHKRMHESHIWKHFCLSILI